MLSTPIAYSTVATAAVNSGLDGSDEKNVPSVFRGHISTV